MTFSSSSLSLWQHPTQQANAGRGKLHHLHQKQRPLPALWRHQVAYTQWHANAFSETGSAENVTDECKKGVWNTCCEIKKWHFFFYRGNFPSTMTSKQIKRCTYHPENEPFCPIFRVGHVLNFTGQTAAAMSEKVFAAVPKASFTRHALKCCILGSVQSVGQVTIIWTGQIKCWIQFDFLQGGLALGQHWSDIWKFLLVPNNNQSCRAELCLNREV